MSTSQKYWTNFKKRLNIFWTWIVNQTQILWATLISTSKGHLNTAQNHLQHIYTQCITKINAFFQNIIDLKNWVILNHTTASDDIKNIAEFIKAFSLRKWTQYQPYIDEFSKWSMVVSTTASTLKVSVQILPIILTMSGVLAGGIPLVGFLFPELFLTELVLFTFVVGVSFFAGHLKYSELVTRAELDAKTERHEKILATLIERVKQLETAYPLSAALQATPNTGPDTEAPKPEKTAMNDAAPPKEAIAQNDDTPTPSNRARLAPH